MAMISEQQSQEENKMINMILDDTNERMTKTIESFQRDLSSVRTGRANLICLIE